MKHRKKLKIARRIAELDNSVWFIDESGKRHRKKGTGVFDGDKWNERKAQIEKEVRKREAKQKETARLRKEKLNEKREGK